MSLASLEELKPCRSLHWAGVKLPMNFWCSTICLGPEQPEQRCPPMWANEFQTTMPPSRSSRPVRQRDLAVCALTSFDCRPFFIGQTKTGKHFSNVYSQTLQLQWVLSSKLGGRQRQLQKKEDRYRAENPSWMDEEVAPADIPKQWQDARANRRMQFKVGNYRDGSWDPAAYRHH